MKIGELARRFGIPASTLRYYERRGLLAPPVRVAGRRSYDDAAVRRVAFIRCAKESGLTLREIKTMIEAGKAGVAPRRLWRRAAEEKVTIIDRKIAALQTTRGVLRSKLACRCRTLAQCERTLSAERWIHMSSHGRGAK